MTAKSSSEVTLSLGDREVDNKDDTKEDEVEEKDDQDAMDIHDPYQYTTHISTMKNMFTHSQVRHRAWLFAMSLLNMDPSMVGDEEARRFPLFKGTFKLCYRLLTEEYNMIRSKIRIAQKRKLRIYRRLPSRRKLTEYTKFCREMKIKYPHEKIVGKIQALWKNHKLQSKLQAMKRPKATVNEEQEQHEQDHQEEEQEEKYND